MPSPRPSNILLTALTLGLAFLPSDQSASANPPATPPVSPTINLPPGTILPVRLNKTLSPSEAQPGQPIEAEIMQEVPLPNGEKINFKSRVLGTIVAVLRPAPGPAAQISLRFNQLEYHDAMLPIFTSVRAIASYQAVHNAQMPLTGADQGTPSGWANTVQIGGDVRYGDGGEVRDRLKQKVGKGVRGGVLVQVRAQPNSGCDGPVNGNDTPQALWVFSSDACGVYGINGLEVTHDGKAPPLGVVTLSFQKPDTKLESFAGILLRTIAQQ